MRQAPRLYLAAGETPKQRNEANTRKVLAWLYAWGFSTRRLLMRVLNVRSAGLLSKLEAAGLVTQVMPNPETGVVVYVLTRAGHDLAAEQETEDKQFTSAMLVRMAPRVRHDLATQRVVLSLNHIRYLPGGLLGELADGLKTPDALVQLEADPADAWTAVEVELTPKSGRELDMTWLRTYEALGAGDYQRVLYVSHNAALLAKYRKQAQGPIDAWSKDALGKWNRTGLRITPKPEHVAAMNWQHVPHLLEKL